MQHIAINTPSKKYTVVVGKGSLLQLADQLSGATAIVVVTDENIARLYGAKACESLNAAGLHIYEWTIPAGEESKSLRQAECLYDYLASKEVDRGGAIVALGGGVVGDLAGFAAATWMRGVRLINCPTTLLSAIDASIGGKTSLNHGGRKNLIGVFHQPDAVLIDTSTFHTLPRRELTSAMAESIKHGLIADPALLKWQSEQADALLARDAAALVKLITRNIEIKARIVEHDERDLTGERAKLNFGHTIGHALEVLLGYQLTHGECVALGMMGAVYIAIEQHLADAQLAETVRYALSQFSLPTSLNQKIDTDQLMMIMRGDKKSVAAKARFVLPKRPGEVISNFEVEDAAIEQAINKLRDG